jgi:hypothetical protein
MGGINNNNFWTGQNPFDMGGLNPSAKKTQGAQSYGYNFANSFDPSTWNVGGPSNDMFQSNFWDLGLIGGNPGVSPFLNSSAKKSAGAKSSGLEQRQGAAVNQPMNPKTQVMQSNANQPQNPQQASAAALNRPYAVSPEDPIFNQYYNAIAGMSGGEVAGTLRQVDSALFKCTGGGTPEDWVRQACIADAQWKQQGAQAANTETSQAGDAQEPKAEQTSDKQETQESVSPSDALYEKLKQGKVVIQPADVDKIDFTKIMAMGPETAKQIIGNMDLTTGNKLPVWQRDLLAVRLAKAMTNDFVDGLGMQAERGNGWSDDLNDDDVSNDDMALMKNAVGKTGNAELARIFDVIDGSYELLDNINGGGGTWFYNNMTKSGTLSEIERQLLMEDGHKNHKDIGQIIADQKKA